MSDKKPPKPPARPIRESVYRGEPRANQDEPRRRPDEVQKGKKPSARKE